MDKKDELINTLANNDLINNKIINEFDDFAPVEKIFSVILIHALDGNAKYIHIEPHNRGIYVKYRYNGILSSSLVLPQDIYSSIVRRTKILADLSTDISDMPQSGKFSLNFNKKNYNFHVSFFPLLNNEKIVIKILGSNDPVPKLSEIGFSEKSSKIIERNIKKKKGLILLAGPANSGIKETFSSLLDILVKEKRNVSTIEDSIQNDFNNINQLQLKPDIGFNFSEALRIVLRDDPEVVLLDNIEERDTAELAVGAAAKNRLIISSIHSDSSLNAILRLINMRIDRIILSSSLNLIIFQRTVKRICDKCKVEAKLSPEILNQIKKEIKKINTKLLKDELPNFDMRKIKFYNGGRCVHCSYSGYNDKILISEVVENNSSIKNKIKSENDVISIRKALESEERLTLKQDAIIKALKGFTTVDEILKLL